MNIRRGFTLIELIVSILIVAILMAILLPVLGGIRHRARSIKCMANLRVILLDFHVFASEGMAEDRGDSAAFGISRFDFEDFAEKSYAIDEFWEGPVDTQIMRPSLDPMICPVANSPLERTPRTRCSDGAINPIENVSYAFNARLETETIWIGDRPFPNRETRLTSRVLESPNVPIAFDVDGNLARESNRFPYFSAPPVKGFPDYYADGTYWFPSTRHNGTMNAAFVGGYVLSSKDPENESLWNWRYQPSKGEPQ